MLPKYQLHPRLYTLTCHFFQACTFQRSTTSLTAALAPRTPHYVICSCVRVSLIRPTVGHVSNAVFQALFVFFSQPTIPILLFESRHCPLKKLSFFLQFQFGLDISLKKDSFPITISTLSQLSQTMQPDLTAILENESWPCCSIFLNYII